MPNQIKFSVIIPVKGEYKKKQFPGCEVIYVDKFTKAEARNYGSKHAHGDYLIHIDKDNEISPKILSQAKRLINKGKYNAIILEEDIKAESIWQKARKLERKILKGNQLLATPQIIKTDLFWKSGGYDERFSELDDWALFMRLRQKKIKVGIISHGTVVFEPTNFFQIFTRRFKKGRELPYFKEVYGSVPQTDVKSLLVYYSKIKPNIPLLILKFFDYSGLFLGSLFPVRSRIDELYMEKNVAEGFNKQQKSFYGNIKHFMEITSLLKMLIGNKKILDLGAGTGRMTKELFKKGYNVTPADISLAMLNEIPRNMPKPILLKSNRLPFRSNYFDAVFSMRVIWHIKGGEEREKLFSEAVRVAKKCIIMDFSFLGSSSDHNFTWNEIKDLAKRNKLQIVNKKYLPLSRLLIKFRKM